MWWISVSDTVLHWAMPPTGMILMQKCLIFEVTYEHFECSLLCGVHLLPWNCLEFPQTQPPCVCSQHWDVSVFSSSFFINDVHKCQQSLPLVFFISCSHWHRGTCDKDSSKSSLLYSYLHWTAWFVCKPLFYLSLFLATCLIIYFPVALPSEEHMSPLLFNSLSKYISVHICLPFWHCIHKWQNPPSLPVLLLVLISGLGPSSSCLLPAPGQLLWKDCGSILACHWRDFNHSQE